MAEELVSSRPGWGELLLNSARQNRFTALGLGIALLGILILLLQSLLQITGGTAPKNLRLAMRGAGFKPSLSVLVAIASGLLEPVGALLGVGLSSGLAIAYPIGLGLAAGAMIFVVSHEVIPETHRNSHQTSATLGLMAGFALMMVLDTALG